MLLATGEHQSATLVSMALHALGVPAISLSGPQAGITTDGRYGRARIASIEPARVRRRDRAGQGRHRGRLPGPCRGPRCSRRRHHDPRSRRQRHDRDRPRRPSRRVALPDLHRRPRHLHRRPATRPRRPPAERHRLRGDARARPPGRPGHADPGGRARLGQRRRHRGPQLVRGRPRNADQGGPARGAAEQGPWHRPRSERREGDDRRRAGSAGHRPEPVRSARRGRRQRRHDRPERRPRRRDRPLVHGSPGGARQDEEDPRGDRPRPRRPRDDDRRLGGEGQHRRAPACTTRRATPPGCSARSPTPG